MPTVTYFVAMPFIRNEEGQHVAGEAQDRQSAGAAESLARRMAETAAGAVAFCRTGDPATGEFDEAVVLREFGEVPSVDQLLGAEQCPPIGGVMKTLRQSYTYWSHCSRGLPHELYLRCCF